MKNSVGSGPEREHGLTYPGENGRMPTDIGADSLLVAQRRQPEVIYSLHYRPHRCEPIRESLRSAGSETLKSCVGYDNPNHYHIKQIGVTNTNNLRANRPHIPRETHR